ncbi:hypothetical protein [Fusobacterium periodonticum]|uniref:DUF4199 domain-containing protein n=2 Tax=Fusobacterium periodonticum TaxID=860 RepID=A0AAD0MPP4_9FUSO|nr:hypothetical protein [Fusobacterium periodonticum]AVQ24752.1 hypothetical protein C4N17_03000 [Fusobacterium periodonticum]KGE63068.1 hypothetical protein FSAG_000755 [Fusobacterium periodonticum 2_1_31]
MATIIRLEKDGYMKDAFVGYSYTTALFNIFVPAARQDLKSFLFMGGIYFLSAFILNFYKIYVQRNLIQYKYGGLISFIALMISWVIAFFYNKYYTQKMLAEGWKPLKDDEYSNVLLKKYNYFEYTDNDLISDERTKEILDEVKKTEKKKALMFVVAAIIQILL